MARQPFNPQYTGTSWAIAPHMIDEMPRLAQLVGQICVNWTGVDMQMGLLLGSLLGVENEAAVAVFLSLRNNRAQRDALVAAAERRLSLDLKQGFDALLAAHSRLDKQRNDVVHGVWGRAERTPDDLIWCSLQDHSNALIRDNHAIRPGEKPKPGYDRTANMTKDVFFARYADLEELNGSIRTLAQVAGTFHVYLRYSGHPAGDHAHEQFFANPMIMEELMSRRPSGQ
jgi:hypothetical protein